MAAMGRPWTPRRVFGGSALALAMLSGCGVSSGPEGGREGSGPHLRTVPAAVRRVPPVRDRIVSTEHLRRAILRGLGRDYLGGTQVGPPSFGLCLQRGMRRLLDEQELSSLTSVYRRPAGQQFTAQALNELAMPVGDRCGGRQYVPELIDASIAFRAGRLEAHRALLGEFGSASTSVAPGMRYTSERYGFSVSVPAGWHRSRARLVPKLLMPREILSVGTSQMPVGQGGSCGREPTAAIERMQPGDALVSIQEYTVTAAMRSRLGGTALDRGTFVRRG